MVNVASEDLSLSRLELVVLARLAAGKPPTEKELGEAVLELAAPGEPPARAREIALEALAALRARGLVSQPGRARQGSLGQRSLTEDGRRALRTAFGVASAPSWLEVRDRHLPALALGLKPGSKQATEALEDADTIGAAVLREQLGISEAPSVADVCDALIAEALGLPPGPLTLGRIRAHVLAQRAGVDAKGTPDDVAKRVVVEALRPRPADKKGMVRALRRRWAQTAAAPPGPGPAPIPASPPQPPQPPPVAPPQPVDTGALLAVVREILPRVGPEGRFGDEKVFVSAIWQRLERDRRLADLSLDRFKRWLVTANRDGWLVLARADLVGAMDPTLVAASEIEDRGATFHFVLDDRVRSGASGKGSHVR